MERREGPPASGGRLVEAPRAACPACGEGELLGLLLRGGDGAARPAAYCGGVYDRARRRYLRPSCGYADSSAPL
jgi:hypothetical protein